jgi:hypothetical protein
MHLKSEKYLKKPKFKNIFLDTILSNGLIRYPQKNLYGQTKKKKLSLKLGYSIGVRKLRSFVYPDLYLSISIKCK